MCWESPSGGDDVGPWGPLPPLLPNKKTPFLRSLGPAISVPAELPSAACLLVIRVRLTCEGARGVHR